MDGKCIYVWFEAVQGYYSCAKLWSQRHVQVETIGKSGGRFLTMKTSTFAFLRKDNIPFHTVIWPALIMGLNHASRVKLRYYACSPGPVIC